MSTSPASERLLDLLGEEALAAGLGQRAVLDAVARGLDGAHLEGEPAGAVRGLQPLPAPRAPGPAPEASRACRCGFSLLASADLPMLRADTQRGPRRISKARPRSRMRLTHSTHGRAIQQRPARERPSSRSRHRDQLRRDRGGRGRAGARRHGPHPLQRGAGAVGGAPPLRRRGAGDRRARPRGMPGRDRGAGPARGRRRVFQPRRRRGHGGARADRRPAGRRDDRQGDRPGARACRWWRSTTWRRTRSPSASPRACARPIFCCWSRAGTPSS